MKESAFVNEFSEETWHQTYKYHTDKNVSDSHRRVAKDLASAEKNPEEWSDKFYDALSDFKVVPGGRITSNAGTDLHGTTYINCFVDGPVVEDKDSIGGIFNALTRAALTLKSEGGYGFCCDFIRPRGAFIHGVGVETPGAVEMLRLWDTMSAVITKGSEQKKKEAKGKNKIRKGAMMVTISCWHPDVEEFITVKSVPGNLTKFNMSVMCSDAFMQAVKDDSDWDLVYPDTTDQEYKKKWDGNLAKWVEEGRKTVVHKTVKAKALWDLIMQSTYGRNEPGVLFIDRMNGLNNLWYNEWVSATNPCLTGDTLVAVADGRGDVSIKQLAEKGEDVPVFCLDDKNKIAIKMMRNPRKTGFNQAIVKVKLDDGSEVRVTKNHKFLLSSGTYVEAKDLKESDSLAILTKSEASIKDVVPSANSNSQDYLWLNTTFDGRLKSEHRMIAEHHQNAKINKGFVVHHKDFNAKNNSPSNLQVMTREDHDRLHGDLMRGDRNPMVRAQTEWSAEKWAAYKGVSSSSFKVDGEKNPRWSGITNEELFEHAIMLTKSLGRRFGNDEWKAYAVEHELVQQLSGWRAANLHGSIKGMAIAAAAHLGIDAEFAAVDPRLQATFLRFAKEGFECRLDQNKVVLRKVCEICGQDFWVWSQKREIGLCSKQCTSEYTSRKNRSPEFIEKASEAQRKVQENYKNQTRSKQVCALNDLRVKLGRDPMRSEWEEECKRAAIPFRLGRSSPFRGFKDLIEKAAMFNHRVVSVKEDGIEDVYNGTVDQFHNFFVGGFAGTSKRFGKPTKVYVNNLQCGEQILPVGGVCLLGSLNLTQFIRADGKDWDYDKLAHYIPIFVRMLDNVNDKTKVPLDEQRWNLQNKRRIGIGYLGYGSALYMMKVRYGSSKALKLTDELTRFVTNTAYQASAMLAAEKGPFPLYDEDKYLKSKFVAMALDKDTIGLIKKHGIRNSHLTSIQPTGNSSVYANNVSSGLEPVVDADYVRTSIVQTPPDGLHVPKINWTAKSYEKSPTEWIWTKEGDEEILATNFKGTIYKIDRNRGLTKETSVVDYGAWVLMQKKEWDPKAEWAANIGNLTIKEHVDTMKVFAKHIDSAMSKTINLPEDYPFDDFKSLYMDMYDSGVIKGGTTYRHGTMTSVISREKTEIGKDTSGRPTEIVATHAPKRPPTLPCEIHQVSIKGVKWIILVGLLNGKPYELFTGEAEQLVLPTRYKTGVIAKVKQGHYNLHVGEGEDELVVKNIVKTFDNEESAWATRMISMALRHGSSVEYVVDQLGKDGGVNDANKVMARVLKKYIPEGTVSTISKKCPVCGSGKLAYQEGCLKCMDCGFSRC